MINIYELGKKGEDLTVDFLKKQGYIIFKRNYHSRYGEIDVIAEKGELLLFVEVKTRIENSMVSPAEAVDFVKQNKIRMTAKEFLSKTLMDYNCRFDVSEVTVHNVYDEQIFRINYIENAFE